MAVGLSVLDSETAETVLGGEKGGQFGICGGFGGMRECWRGFKGRGQGGGNWEGKYQSSNSDASCD